ncbi:MAG: hypothetical protein EBV38_07940, partial [Burkholderiaceae bacterium]|nr:hypothetical protein [Burkholderiaceae bacterium]
MESLLQKFCCITVPQTRNGGFYPSVIQKGLRSERALLATIAEM